MAFFADFEPSNLVSSSLSLFVRQSQAVAVEASVSDICKRLGFDRYERRARVCVFDKEDKEDKEESEEFFFY